MSNGIYKATVVIRCLGQEIVNALWYRDVLEGTFASDLFVDASVALGKSIVAHVWNDGYASTMPTFAYLDRVQVVGYNDQYELLYNNAVTVVPSSEDANGTASGSEVFLPIANCVNIRLNLRPRLITFPWFRPPQKGLISVGPVMEQYAGNDGTLNDTGKAAYEPLASAVGGKLPWDFYDIDLPFTNWTPTVGIPDVFIPLRAKVWQYDTPTVLGGVTYLKHIETTDVESATVRAMLGYRRSRRVEG
jgi:hypothetical protein